MSKESKAGAGSRSTKTKTSKSTRKKKEVIVTEDETPKAKTSRKSVKSSQKKVQKEVGTVFLFGLIWGRNRAPFPMPKSIFYSQLLTYNSQLKNCESSTEENHSFLS